MAELKPCPFCGSPAELRIIETEIGKRSVIRCINTNCYMCYQHAFTSWHDGESKEHTQLRLTTAWNRRAEDGK
jgi:hypothetical protein